VCSSGPFHASFSAQCLPNVAIARRNVWPASLPPSRGALCLPLPDALLRCELAALERGYVDGHMAALLPVPINDGVASECVRVCVCHREHWMTTPVKQRLLLAVLLVAVLLCDDTVCLRSRPAQRAAAAKQTGVDEAFACKSPLHRSRC